MKEAIATPKQSHSAIRHNSHPVSRLTLHWIQAHPPLLDITGSKPGSHFARNWREFWHGQIFALKNAIHSQEIADMVAEWSAQNRVKLNSDKCKELRISFAKDEPQFAPIVVDGNELESN